LDSSWATLMRQMALSSPEKMATPSARRLSS
jgi:hypothetical protein